MNVWAFIYDQKRLLQLLSTLSQNLENTMKYLYNKQDCFFFFAYDASYSFFTHDTKKKKKGFLPSPPPKKKTDKGFRVQIMQLLGEELPCQQSASNGCTAAGAGRASLECWGRRGQHGAGVWCGPRSSPVHAGC